MEYKEVKNIQTKLEGDTILRKDMVIIAKAVFQTGKDQELWVKLWEVMDAHGLHGETVIYHTFSGENKPTIKAALQLYLKNRFRVERIKDLREQAQPKKRKKR